MENPLLQEWVRRSMDPRTVKYQEGDTPNYWAGKAQSLSSLSDIHSFAIGTGESIYRGVILPHIEEAQDEVILVTCFWARSSTLSHLSDSLRKLSAKGIRSGNKIRVRICFSSSSLLQKLFHTRSLKGHTYPASKWQAQFGLPAPQELQGLDLEIKSVFVLPFSVMHPKFMIVDRQRVLLPSCNVSWEDWFEGCVDITGPAIEQFVRFWHSFWAGDADKASLIPLREDAMQRTALPYRGAQSTLGSKELNLVGVPSLLLPSPHHASIRLSWPWQSYTAPPPTPLNTFLLAMFTNAKHSIYVQTPNLTSTPVLRALTDALRRGVHVRIVTSERLMLLEQLVTAWTTTSRCVRRLIRDHQTLLTDREDQTLERLESGRLISPGRLEIFYYVPDRNALVGHHEPVQSHLKLTLIDNEIVVLGSGNMDRASWYTSQELGVAFFSQELASEMQSMLSSALKRRLKRVYNCPEANTT